MLFGMLLSLVTPFLTQAMVDDGIGMRDMGLILNILFAQVFIFIGTFLMGLISSHVSLYMRLTQKSKIYKIEVDLFGYLSEIVFKYSILAK